MGLIWQEIKTKIAIWKFVIFGMSGHSW